MKSKTNNSKKNWSKNENNVQKMSKNISRRVLIKKLNNNNNDNKKKLV